MASWIDPTDSELRDLRDSGRMPAAPAARFTTDEAHRELYDLLSEAQTERPVEVEKEAA